MLMLYVILFSYLDELPERLLRLVELREPDERLRDRELADVELDDEYLYKKIKIICEHSKSTQTI